MRKVFDKWCDMSFGRMMICSDEDTRHRFRDVWSVSRDVHVSLSVGVVLR